jgi:DNA-binding CsgD family transcriptional regulator
MWLVSTAPITGNLPFDLEAGEFVLGRSKKIAQIVLKDRTVSKRHARLVNHGESVGVEDLGSRNGTFVNGQPVTLGRAELGDRIQFGAVRCVLASSPVSQPLEAMSQSTFRARSPGAPTIDIASELTAVQHEIVGLLLEGLDEQEIAARIGRQPSTVHTHLQAICQHFQVRTRDKLIKLLTDGKPHRLP